MQVSAPVWGFELVHNDGPHEALDVQMLSLLQRGFLAASRLFSGNTWPCGMEAASAMPDMNVTAAPSTLLMKSYIMGLPAGKVHFQPHTTSYFLLPNS